jgi:hypothetical protein
MVRYQKEKNWTTFAGSEIALILPTWKRFPTRKMSEEDMPAKDFATKLTVSWVIHSMKRTHM